MEPPKRHTHSKVIKVDVMARDILKAFSNLYDSGTLRNVYRIDEEKHIVINAYFPGLWDCVNSSIQWWYQTNGVFVGVASFAREAFLNQAKGQRSRPPSISDFAIPERKLIHLFRESKLQVGAIEFDSKVANRYLRHSAQYDPQEGFKYLQILRVALALKDEEAVSASRIEDSGTQSPIICTELRSQYNMVQGSFQQYTIDKKGRRLA
ncbi:hypothetical protein LZ32DRAFT_666509 [Colletotrichum eremochloae]|nr:hypothetical protein LZ32DRAFT_666509 [Colletotrichum eremochloae]